MTNNKFFHPFITILILVICFSGCSKKNTNEYHQNDHINYLIEHYNKTSLIKIVNVSREFHYQVFLNHDNLSIRISSNNRDTFIDVSDEASADKLPNIFKHGDIFVKIAKNSLNLQHIHKQLRSGKYQNYKYLELDELKFQLFDQPFGNKKHRYKYSITIPNNLLNKHANKAE